jgi:hypothetical protein
LEKFLERQHNGVNDFMGKRGPPREPPFDAPHDELPGLEEQEGARGRELVLPGLDAGILDILRDETSTVRTCL